MKIPIKKPDENSLLYLKIALLFTLCVFIALLWCIFSFSRSISLLAPEKNIITTKLKKEAESKKIIKQLEELEKQKEEIPSPSNEEIKKQLEELNKIK